MAKPKRAAKAKAKPKKAKPAKKKVAAKKAKSAKPAKAKAKAKAKPKAKPAKAAKPKAAKPKTAKPAKAAKPAAKPAAAPSGDHREQLEREILEMARDMYGPKLSDAQLLALDPNSIDEMDPSMFYELLGERYGVEADPDNDYFGGFGGPITNLIDFVAARWDGVTNHSTPKPPTDWLEDYVHPAGEAATTPADPNPSGVPLPLPEEDAAEEDERYDS